MSSSNTRRSKSACNVGSLKLPVPGVPEVDVSSVLALDQLQQATNPQYNLITTFADFGSRGVGDAGALSDDDAPGLGGADGGIVVAFDVQPDGSVANQRDFAKLEAGGSGESDEG